MPAAAEKAHRLGCECLQIFTASPRQWKASPVAADRAARFCSWRKEFDLAPLVVHANYLINVAGTKPDFHAQSKTALRGELERAASVEADYLVLHPGSGEAQRCIDTLLEVCDGFAWGGLRLLIENTAGGGSHLAGDFGQWRQLLQGVAAGGVPVGGCFDTCHAWVAGYDLVSPSGYRDCMAQLDDTVGLGNLPVIHANDAKAARGSHRDRHEHIGDGQLGQGVFRQMLNDPGLAGKAFILETPVDEPDDQIRDLQALRSLLRAQ